jgi:ribosome biogenesis GTPase
MQLSDLGWSAGWQGEFEHYAARGQVPARVIREEREAYLAESGRGSQLARVTGRLRAAARGRADFPAVGDWVVLEPAAQGGDGQAHGVGVIHAVLPRRSMFVRRAAGRTGDAQPVATNVDVVFLVSGLDGDFNARRIERYLTLAWESGAAPVVVLNKADLCPDLESRVAETEALAVGTPVLAVSAAEGRGLDALRAQVGPGTTAAFLGSSGVGKSSLINALCGESRQRTAAVRADDSRGRHTTTQRELLRLPGGGVLIDTPGMRELQLWGDEAGLEQAFADVTELAAGCRFRDCAHGDEPGCAVRRALTDGRLAPERFASFQKLQRELRHLARKEDVLLRIADEARWKKLMRVGKERARRKQ